MTNIKVFCLESKTIEFVDMSDIHIDDRFYSCLLFDITERFPFSDGYYLLYNSLSIVMFVLFENGSPKYAIGRLGNIYAYDGDINDCYCDECDYAHYHYECVLIKSVNPYVESLLDLDGISEDDIWENMKKLEEYFDGFKSLIEDYGRNFGSVMVKSAKKINL